MAKNVLLIGRNLTVLTQLAEALTNKGFEVKTTNLVEQASQNFNGADFDLVTFERGVDKKTNEQLPVLADSQLSVPVPQILIA